MLPFNVPYGAAQGRGVPESAAMSTKRHGAAAVSATPRFWVGEGGVSKGI